MTYFSIGPPYNRTRVVFMHILGYDSFIWVGRLPVWVFESTPEMAAKLKDHTVADICKFFTFHRAYENKFALRFISNIYYLGEKN